MTTQQAGTPPLPAVVPIRIETLSRVLGYLVERPYREVVPLVTELEAAVKTAIEPVAPAPSATPEPAPAAPVMD